MYQSISCAEQLLNHQIRHGRCAVVFEGVTYTQLLADT